MSFPVSSDECGMRCSGESDAEVPGVLVPVRVRETVPHSRQGSCSRSVMIALSDYANSSIFFSVLGYIHRSI